jgi:elongation factor 2
MKSPETIRNVGIVAHIDHGKTTLTDALLANAGMLSFDLVGQARALDYLEEEQRRGNVIAVNRIRPNYHQNC